MLQTAIAQHAYHTAVRLHEWTLPLSIWMWVHTLAVQQLVWHQLHAMYEATVRWWWTIESQDAVPECWLVVLACWTRVLVWWSLQTQRILTVACQAGQLIRQQVQRWSNSTPTAIAPASSSTPADPAASVAKPAAASVAPKHQRAQRMASLRTMASMARVHDAANAPSAAVWNAVMDNVAEAKEAEDEVEAEEGEAVEVADLPLLTTDSTTEAPAAVCATLAPNLMVGPSVLPTAGTSAVTAPVAEKEEPKASKASMFLPSFLTGKNKKKKKKGEAEEPPAYTKFSLYRPIQPQTWSGMQPDRTTIHTKGLLDQAWNDPQSWRPTVDAYLGRLVLALVQLLTQWWQWAQQQSRTSPRTWSRIVDWSFGIYADRADLAMRPTMNPSGWTSDACDVCVASRQLDDLYRSTTAGLWIHPVDETSRTYRSALVPMSQPIATTAFSLVSAVSAEWSTVQQHQQQHQQLSLTGVYVNDILIPRPACPCQGTSHHDSKHDESISDQSAPSAHDQRQWRDAVELCVAWTSLQTQLALARGSDSNTAVLTTLYTMMQTLDARHPMRLQHERALLDRVPSASADLTGRDWLSMWSAYQDDLVVAAEGLQVTLRQRIGPSMRFPLEWIRQCNTAGVVPYVQSLQKRFQDQASALAQSLRGWSREHRDQWKQWVAHLRMAAGVPPKDKTTDAEDVDFAIGTLFLANELRTDTLRGEHRMQLDGAAAWSRLLTPVDLQGTDGDDDTDSEDDTGLAVRRRRHTTWLHVACAAMYTDVERTFM